MSFIKKLINSVLLKIVLIIAILIALMIATGNSPFTINFEMNIQYVLFGIAGLFLLYIIFYIIEYVLKPKGTLLTQSDIKISSPFWGIFGRHRLQIEVKVTLNKKGEQMEVHKHKVDVKVGKKEMKEIKKQGITLNEYFLQQSIKQVNKGVENATKQLPDAIIDESYKQELTDIFNKTDSKDKK